MGLLDRVARLHQNLAQSMADLNLHEQQYNQSVTQAQEWEKRAILAIQKGAENLAREALSRKKTHADLAATLKAESRQVETLKKSLIIETQTELVKLRQILEQSMATLKSKEAEYNQCTLQLQDCDQRSLLALQNGDENLANENLRQKENYGSLAETLKSELDLQLMQIDTLKKNLIAIEVKIFKAKSEPSDVRLITCFTTNDEMSIDELESRLTKLEADSSVDPELAALKAKIMESCSSEVLPPSDTAK